MTVLVLAVLTLNVLVSRAEREVSAVDEREHIDHLIQASRGNIPQGGTELTQETLRELCSRGSEYMQLPACRPGRLDPSDYAVGGINVAGDRPFYYLATGPSARALRALTPGWESLVTWGRVLGSVWFLVGAYFVLRAGDALRVSRWVLISALALAAAIPVQLAASTTVTPDATAFTMGAAMLLTGLWWERTGRGLWLLGLLGVVAVLFEPVNALGAFVVLVYFAIRAVTAATGDGPAGDGREWRQYALAGVIVVISLAAGLVGWEKIEDRRDPPPPHIYTQQERESAETLDPLRTESSDQGLSVERVLSGSTVFAMFPPVVDVAPPISRLTGPHGWWYQTLMLAAAIAMSGALLLCALRPNPRDRIAVLGLATAIALVAGAALMVLGRYYLYDGYDPIVPRLGLSALPAIALTVAGVARGRIGQGLVVTLGAGLYLTALLTLV